MKALLQRVERAEVRINDEIAGEIGRGYLILLGVHKEDEVGDADWLVKKILDLRLWDDADGKMNLDLAAVGGSLLVVSQFTLYGNARKGRRPSYDKAAGPEHGEELYEYFVQQARQLLEPNGGKAATGRFGATMKVELVNDGPVTLILESREPRRHSGG